MSCNQLFKIFMESKSENPKKLICQSYDFGKSGRCYDVETTDTCTYHLDTLTTSQYNEFIQYNTIMKYSDKYIITNKEYYKTIGFIPYQYEFNEVTITKLHSD
jgi:hypothetical protein